MNEELRQMVIETLRRGEELPAEWAPLLFSPSKRESELTYFGKEREEEIIANTIGVPFQPVRTFGKSIDGTNESHNMLILGDNLQCMKTLLEMKNDGKLLNADGTPGIRLVYIDPPFATKQEFSGSQEQKAYQDKIIGAEFIEFLRRRLILLREVLADDGSIYIHLDTKKFHYIKITMDEIFGEENFINEICWKRINAKGNVTRKWGAIHEMLLFYAKRASNYVWNQVYRDLDPSYVEKMYRYVEEDTGRRYRVGDLTAPASRASKGQVYKWKGYDPGPTRCWVHAEDKMIELESAGRIVYTSNGYPQFKRYLDENSGEKIPDWWDDITPVSGNESMEYPTQKPQTLLERIIGASSNPGDLVLDAFAGSGTTCAVAEKLGRRWIGIDCGKLSIYTIQKRMLSLKEGSGQKGKHLQPKPFTLYNAGLYDFSTLRQLPWKDWRFFALQLFGCKDEPHKIGGLELDGKRQGASVLVFNHLDQPGRRIDEETIQSIHATLGDKVGSRFFIIAPRGVFEFQQDYIDLEEVRYYALRIPYSFINELHHREFTALKQPSDETDVNAIVDAVGFDFIRPPQVTWTIEKATDAMATHTYLQIQRFESRAYIRGQDTRGGMETLSLLLIDFAYDGELFVADQVLFANALKAADWQARLPLAQVGEQNMLVFIDIYGNEARELVRGEQLGLVAAPQTIAEGA